VIRELNVENPFGGRVLKSGSTESTMDLARELVTAGEAPGCVILADVQSKGRGRVPGRRWLAPAGSSLLGTLVLDRKAISFLPGLAPLLTALGLARCVKELTGLSCKLKWPNDLLIEGKKISGILCEFSRHLLFVGIGLNLLQDRIDGDIKGDGAINGRESFPAASIKMVTGLQFRPEDVLPLLLGNLKIAYQEPHWKRSWEELLYARGERVTMLVGDPSKGNTQSGTILGLGNSGELLLDTEEGVISLFSAESVMDG
jgi:BirA family transcriptional regulator, biotin operon repressor / biotin---[acetyl-CoA-carboxylase] ligase